MMKGVDYMNRYHKALENIETGYFRYHADMSENIVEDFKVLQYLVNRTIPLKHIRKENGNVSYPACPNCLQKIPNVRNYAKYKEFYCSYCGQLIKRT